MLGTEPDLLMEGFGRLGWTAINRSALQGIAERADKLLHGSVRAKRLLHGSVRAKRTVHRKDDRESFLRKLWKLVPVLDGAQQVAQEARRIGFELTLDPHRFDLFHAFAYCPPGRLQFR